MIEIRHVEDELAVGIDARCEEFARDGDALVAVSGEHGPKVAVLAADSAGYQVIRVEAPPDGAGFAPWVERSFSAAGADELDQPIPAEDLPEAQARRTHPYDRDSDLSLPILPNQTEA